MWTPTCAHWCTCACLCTWPAWAPVCVVHVRGWPGRREVGGRATACLTAPPAAPRSCIIDKDELKDGLRVLIPMDDKLLYAGHVQTVHSPDM